LEDRVEEINKHLQGNQEKLAVYERRGVSGLTQHTTGMNGEEQLESEVAELRSVY
jgi:nucleoprotein TPR